MSRLAYSLFNYFSTCQNINFPTRDMYSVTIYDIFFNGLITRPYNSHIHTQGDMYSITIYDIVTNIIFCFSANTIILLVKPYKNIMFRLTSNCELMMLLYLPHKMKIC